MLSEFLAFALVLADQRVLLLDMVLQAPIYYEYYSARSYKTNLLLHFYKMPVHCDCCHVKPYSKTHNAVPLYAIGTNSELIRTCI